MNNNKLLRGSELFSLKENSAKKTLSIEDHLDSDFSTFKLEKLNVVYLLGCGEEEFNNFCKDILKSKEL